jgi:hypothetical protein
MSKPWKKYCYGTSQQPYYGCCDSNRDEEGKPLNEMSRCDDAEGDFVAHFCKDCESKTLGKYEPRIWSSNYRPFDEYGGNVWKIGFNPKINKAIATLISGYRLFFWLKIRCFKGIQRLCFATGE